MATDEPTLRFLDSTVDLAVIHASRDGLVTHWRGAAERLLGYTAEEAIGMSLSAFFPAEDLARGLDAQEIAVALAQGRSEDDRWHVRKDGGLFWASGVLTAVTGEDGESLTLCKILRDRTDVKTQIHALENVVASLKAQRERERNEMELLAHELRNPLHPMMVALALLQRDDAAHLARRAIHTLAGQIELLQRLINDLDAVGTSHATAPVLAPEPVNLSLVLSRLVETLLPPRPAAERRLSLVLPKEGIWIYADPSRLQQILLNLLSNAAKYTLPGGRIDVNATIEGAMAVVRIDDDGIGISPEMLTRIFDLFTREGQSPGVDGKGVGLAVVQQLAAAHGGSVDVRSPGRNLGSTFSLRMPTYRPPGQ
jgi:PAS domain S-box-containing protein